MSPDILAKYGKSFCVFPFTQVNIRNDGRVRPCCRIGEYANRNGLNYTVYNHSFPEIWNSEYMRNMRKKMINGEIIRPCLSCIAREKYNPRAPRISGSESRLKSTGLTVEQIIHEAERNDFYVHSLPSHYHLEITDKCNSKCRSCNASSSSLIKHDIVHSAWCSRLVNHPSLTRNVPIESRFPNDQLWHAQPTLWNELFSDNLKWLYIIGGEPMIIKEHELILDYLCKENIASGVDLSYNTNLSYFSETLLTSLAKFKSVGFKASIDAKEELYEYMRYPSKWKNVTANVDKIADYDSISIQGSPLVTVYNFFYLTELLQFFDKHEISLAFIILQTPEFLSPTIAPMSLRREAARNLKVYKEIYCRDSNKNQVDVVISFLEEAPDNFNKKRHLLYEFNLFTNDLDQTRNQSIHDVCPDLIQSFSNEGYTWSDRRCFSFLHTIKQNFSGTLTNDNILTDKCFIKEYSKMSTILYNSLPDAFKKNVSKPLSIYKHNTSELLEDLRTKAILFECSRDTRCYL